MLPPYLYGTRAQPAQQCHETRRLRTEDCRLRTLLGFIHLFRAYPLFPAAGHGAHPSPAVFIPTASVQFFHFVVFDSEIDLVFGAVMAGGVFIGPLWKHIGFGMGKYAGIGGVYSIPTANALVSQLSLCGFRAVKVQHNALLTAAEQRSAEFSPQPSLTAALREDGFSKEGYPPPYRAAIFAYR